MLVLSQLLDKIFNNDGEKIADDLFVLNNYLIGKVMLRKNLALKAPLILATTTMTSWRKMILPLTQNSLLLVLA